MTSYNDCIIFLDTSNPSYVNLGTLDRLLEWDKQREQDGFPRKIKIGRVLKPGKNEHKVKIVPTVVEDKLVHDNIKIPQQSEEGGDSGGSGEGEEGEVIGEAPIDDAGGQGSGEGGAGEGDAGEHEMEADAYDLGKILTEKFELPNLQNKGATRSLTNYTYELTDTNQGTGQLLDKKKTLEKIVDTNTALGRISPDEEIDTTDLIVSPNDKIYRILSREKDYESQALVFFLRDYSGSMHGLPTQQVVETHVLIFSWLLYQYNRQVETRFILHDTEAKEVPDFYSYYNSRVAGGTRIASAYNLVNNTIEAENLYKDYNIYVFHGTDGDDWDKKGEDTLPAIRNTLKYANRIGITVCKNTNRSSELEEYIAELLRSKRQFIKLHSLIGQVEEKEIIEGIKDIIKEEDHATAGST